MELEDWRADSRTVNTLFAMPDVDGMSEDSRFRLLFDAAPDPMLCVDTDGRILLVNSQMERLVGYTADELVGQLVEVLVPQRVREIHEKHRASYVAMAQPRSMGLGLQLAVRKKDGNEIPVDINLNEVNIAGSSVIVNSLRVRGAQMRFQAAFHHAPIGIALVDRTGKILIANDALTTMLSLDNEPEGHANFLTLAHPTDRDRLVKVFEDLGKGEIDSHCSQCRLIASDGRVVWATLSATPASDVAGVPRSFILQLEDITERLRAVEVLEHQASHDPLTGLPNRVLFADRLRQALARDQRSGRHTAVLYVDVDRFKSINDVFGHEVGDAALLELAGRMKMALRPSDTLARLAGDEFRSVRGRSGRSF